MKVDSIPYYKKISINGVKFSFHPAGHILGSAQIRVEYKGEVWVVSGDYKVEDDGLAEKFEVVKCDTFITESTFGIPVYKWDDQAIIHAQINDWWKKNREEGKTSLLTGYSLGKAQRLLQGLDPSIGKIFTHNSVEEINAIMRKQGVKLHDTIKVSKHQTKKMYIGNMVIAPPSAANNPWVKNLGPVSVAMASGWMKVRGVRRRRSADQGFVLSDHADWTGLVDSIEATGAERVFVTHGYSNIFARWLCEKGYVAAEVKTDYGEEEV